MIYPPILWQGSGHATAIDRLLCLYQIERSAIHAIPSSTLQQPHVVEGGIMIPPSESQKSLKQFDVLWLVQVNDHLMSDRSELP